MSEVIKCAIVGSGAVGQAVGGNLQKSAKVEVIFGARDPAKTLAKIKDGALKDVKVLSISEALEAAQCIILAVPGAADDAGIQKIATDLGSDCQDKIIIDATNPLTAFPQLAVRWGQAQSGGEVLAQALPKAKVYKAFNTVGVEHLATPDGSVSGSSVPEDMLVAGDPDSASRSTVLAIVRAAGFRPHYVGGIRYARNLEAIAELWIHCCAPVIGECKEVGWGRNFNFGVYGEVPDES